MCLRLFLTFLKVSTFTLGGGLVMLPLIQREVVQKRKWIGEEEFLDIVAISSSLPGALVVNVATPIGYSLRGRLGALFAATGAVLPPFVVIVLIASLFLGIRNVPIVEAMFKGIRPCVVALIAIAVINLCKAARINRRTFIVLPAVAIPIVLLGIHPIYPILLAIAANGIRVAYRKGGRQE
jgi:chromate transporter